MFNVHEIETEAVSKIPTPLVHEIQTGVKITFVHEAE